MYQDFHFLPLLDVLAQKGNFYRLFEIVLLMKSMGVTLKLKVFLCTTFYFLFLIFDFFFPVLTTDSSCQHFNSVIMAIGRSPDNMDKAYFALEDLKSQKTLDILIFNIVLAGCSQGRVLIFFYFLNCSALVFLT